MKTKFEGDRGENLAEGFLKEKGYKILDRNKTLMNIEVDIIAEAPSGDICFIEVKSRSSYAFGQPLEAVTFRKIKRYKQFIKLYADIKKLYDRTLRIDVIAVTGDGAEHIENVGF